MKLPFLHYFKRAKAAAGGVAIAPRPATPIDKPASERFGKTVMPNVSRVVGVEPAQSSSMAVPVGNPTSVAPSSAHRKISLGGNGAFGLGSKPVSAPAAEYTIALQLVDLVPHLPAGLLQTTPVDPEQRILFKTSELERGMASGRPSVLLRTIFQQAPDFFLSDVEATDTREVVLPFSKVLEQFAAFQVRADQLAGEAVPQVETPFLKLTIEDGERFGTPATPVPAPTARAISSSPEPEPAPEVASAPTAAAIKPEKAPVPTALRPGPVSLPDVLPQPSRPIRLCPPNESKTDAAGDSAAGHNQTPEPARLEPLPARPPLAAKKITPNGMGVSAAERVPASSGPPIPTPLPAPFASPSPVRIPFKVSPPSNDLREPLRSATSASLPKAAAVAFSAEGPRVRLSLRAVLREISPFQLSGPIDDVPETATIEIPFSIIEPQLSLGRIAVSPSQFRAALPEEYRSLLKVEEIETPVALPLREVLQNLPGESLQLRGDQEEVALAEAFETPFSTKAAEDAARMKISTGPIAKPALAVPGIAPAAASPAVAGGVDPGLVPGLDAIAKAKPIQPGTTVVARIAEPAAENAAPTPTIGILNATTSPSSVARPEMASPAADAAPPVRTVLQMAFDTDETLDAKTIVAHTSRLPGVSACAIVFSDGLSLAGNIPAEYEAEALCALAPSIVKRIDSQMIGTGLGPLNGITLYCAKTPVSFFAHGNICLATLHSAGEIAADVRARLGCTVRELARMYAQPA